nr:bile acid:sodium symporter [Arthrobacter roseus]
MYFTAIAAGGVIGWFVPGAQGPLANVITPALGLLLYATFLGVPFVKIGAAIHDGRFMAAILVLNFLMVPAVVFGLSRFVADDVALLTGVLLVLLTPCIDYVIVFSGLAGGATDRLLAAAPILMLTQMVLLPVYLLMSMGPNLVTSIEPKPFIEALVFLIIVPLALAAVTQRWARRAGTGRTIMSFIQGLMVPLMMLTLAAVVGSQIADIGAQIGSLTRVVPVYIAFLVLMVPLGLWASRIAGLNAASATSVVFSGATRNSLVVLPLALALPESLSLVPLVVVTQTIVELIAMVIFVRLIPRLVSRSRAR